MDTICKGSWCLDCKHMTDADETEGGKLVIACNLEFDHKVTKGTSCPMLVFIGTPTEIDKSGERIKKEYDDADKAAEALMPLIEGEDTGEEESPDEMEHSNEVLLSKQLDFIMVQDDKGLRLIPAPEDVSDEVTQYRFTEYEAANINRELGRIDEDHRQAASREATQYLLGMGDGQEDDEDDEDQELDDLMQAEEDDEFADDEETDEEFEEEQELLGFDDEELEEDEEGK